MSLISYQFYGSWQKGKEINKEKVLIYDNDSKNYDKSSILE